MLDVNATSAGAGVAALVLAGVLTVPAMHDIIAYFRAPKVKASLYEDKDGIATSESMGHYSATVPKILLALFSILGFFSGIALAVIATVDRDDDPMLLENWLNVGSWVCISNGHLGWEDLMLYSFL